MNIEETLLRYTVDNGNLKAGTLESIDLQDRLSKAAKESGKATQAVLDQVGRGYRDLNNQILANARTIKGSTEAIKDFERQIGILEQKQKGLKESSLQWRAIDREIDKLKANIKTVNRELGNTQDEMKKTGKSGNFLTNAVGGLTKSFGAFFAAIGIAGGLKVLIQTRLEINKQTKAVQQLSGETKVASREIAKEIRAIAKVYKKDFQEVLIASNAVSKEFGLTQNQVLKRIREGFQAGSDINGEFLGTLREYPAQFKAAGASADLMFSIINRSVKEGIYSDKGVDAIKEGTISIREMTKATSDALKSIGLDSDQIQKDLEADQTTIIEVIQQVSERLSELPPQSKEVGQVLADVFRGAGEDSGLRFLTVLKDIDGELEVVKDETTEYQDAMFELSKEVDSLATAMTRGLQKSITGVLKTGARLAGFFSKIVEIKASDELRAQKEELNILVGAIRLTNQGERVRVGLIAELQQKYPDFLGNLKAETVTNEQLAGRLKEVNAQLEQKILNQLKEEEFRDLLAERKELRGEELDLLKEIKAAQDEIGKNQAEFDGFVSSGDLIQANEDLEENRKKQEEVAQSIAGLDTKYRAAGLVATETAKKAEEATVKNAATTSKVLKGFINGLNKRRQELQKQLNELSEGDLFGRNRILRELNVIEFEIESFMTRFLSNIDLSSGFDEIVKQADGSFEEFLNQIRKRAGAEIEPIPIRGSGSGKTSTFLSRLLGVTPDQVDEALSALSQTLSTVQDMLTRDAQLKQKLAEENIDALDQQIRNQERNLELQIGLQKKGLANSVETAQEEINRLNEMRQQEAARRREALREEQRTQSVEQSINLITSASNLYRALSPLGPFGIGLAVAAIGTMFASFAKTKADAREATQQEFYEGGFSDEGGFTGQGTATSESKRVGKKPYKYHQGEYIADHNKTQEFRPLFEAMESGTISSMGDLLPGIPESLKAPHMPGFDLKSLAAAKQKEKDEQLKRVSTTGNREIVKRLESLEATNAKHYAWLQDIGVPINMPDGSLVIHGKNRKKIVKVNSGS